MAVSTDTAPARRANSPLRFSLRFLLLAVTAFATGFAVWYRWPYIETVKHPISRGGSPTAPAIHRIVTTTWQREWGGERVKHGIERIVDPDGANSEETFCDGRLHGPCQYARRHSTVVESGEYHDGKQHGVWTARDGDGKFTRRVRWNHGKLHGIAEMIDPDSGAATAYEFAEGRLVSINGEAVRTSLIHDWPLSERQQLPEIFENPANYTFMECPLSDTLAYISAEEGLTILVDPQHANRSHSVTADFHGIPLIAVLDIISTSTDNVFCLRNGGLFLTSAEAASASNPNGIDTDILTPNAVVEP